MPIKLGILGSTRGTSLQPVIDAINQKKLDAEIKIIISNKKKAYILERALNFDIKNKFVSSFGRERKDFDQKVSQTLKQNDVDLIILIGYMRILSPNFVKNWAGKILNVHPSLLPLFPGLMNEEVHKAVLNSKIKETGCTVHIVTEQVDTGPIVIQKKCKVLSNDTIETLKQRVQNLEGSALIEAINIFNARKI